MKNKLQKVIKRQDQPEQVNKPARITNDNLAEHREEVIGRARRFIYPLQHSKHSLVKISVGILVAALVLFTAYCVIALYRLKSSSEFLYQVTNVVPFPVARIGSDFVAYENYLFEINRYKHYYQNQQNVDFNSENGKRQLEDFKKRALNLVINEAYVREIAQQRGITVTDEEVNKEIETIRSQNRLGASDQEFESVLREFWGWSIDDFKRVQRQEILKDKVVAELDVDARKRAEEALARLKAGEDFAKLARKVSEDPSTKDNGGAFRAEITKNDRDISPKTVNALFQLEPGQFSEIINIGYGLEIVKTIEKNDENVRGAHIIFNFKDIEEYLRKIKDERPARSYISF